MDAQIAAAQSAFDEHAPACEYSRFAKHVDIEKFVERLTREQRHYGIRDTGYAAPANADRRDAMREHDGRTFKVRWNSASRSYEVIQTSRDLRIEPPTAREVNNACCTANPDKRGPAALANMFQIG